MAGYDVLHPDGSDYGGFLYAFVGLDRHGSMVTVLSTLARLGLDPWKEASELAGLSEGAATTRLDGLLARFSDVPALTGEHETIARKLISLLPARAARQLPSQAGSAQIGTRTGAVKTIVLIAISLVLLARLLIPGVSGLGD